MTDYDLRKEFSKRKLESNWSKYDEISDEEENEQMKAADFGAILLAPKSIGTHFTLKSEKHWDQSNENDDSTAAGTIFSKLFQLNLVTLKNGVGRLPFYMRNDCPKEIFTDHEIADMEHKVNYTGEQETARSLTTYNQNILNILRNGDQELTKKLNDGKDIVNADKIGESGGISAIQTTSTTAKTTEHTDRQTTDESDLLDDIFDDLRLDASRNSSQLMPQKKAHSSILKKIDDVSKTSTESTSGSRLASKSQNSPAKSSNPDDIQNWLDDILNE